MFILECKSCGAQINCEDGRQTITCPYCGTQNTAAKQAATMANAFNRANYLRRINEFDKAIAAYEEILNQDNTEYEAHWGLALCKYGIEFVEDPDSQQCVPTCHRTQYDSILTDPSYQSALEYAPYEIKSVYENEGAKIAQIQKEILALAEKEEDFDVFLCYKETDESGNRTPDSVIAQEIYEELVKRNYKVFFARKTLENKLGSAYEPIIFSALNSAEIMIILGTNPSYFTSPWLKNEWSRYRERMKKGASVSIIPAYRDMSPYDLPQEFSNLQALDMSKIGFLQDLCDGLEKLKKKNSATPAYGTDLVTPPVENLLGRAYLFLQDRDFQSADEYFERVLDYNLEESRAYIGKLLVELALTDETALNEQHIPLARFSNFQKAIRFATPEQKMIYEGYAHRSEENIKIHEEKLRKQEQINKIREQQRLEERKKETERRRLERERREKIAEEEGKRQLKKALILSAIALVFIIIICIFFPPSY